MLLLLRTPSTVPPVLIRPSRWIVYVIPAESRHSNIEKL
jgi:hypothetical protein